MTTKRYREEQLRELAIRLREDKDAFAEFLRFHIELHRQQVEIMERMIDAMMEAIRRGDREGMLSVKGYTPGLGTSEAVGEFKLVSPRDELVKQLLQDLKKKRLLEEPEKL